MGVHGRANFWRMSGTSRDETLKTNKQKDDPGKKQVQSKTEPVYPGTWKEFYVATVRGMMKDFYLPSASNLSTLFTSNAKPFCELSSSPAYTTVEASQFVFLHLFFSTLQSNLHMKAEIIF